MSFLGWLFGTEQAVQITDWRGELHQFIGERQVIEAQRAAEVERNILAFKTFMERVVQPTYQELVGPMGQLGRELRFAADLEPVRVHVPQRVEIHDPDADPWASITWFYQGAREFHFEVACSPHKPVVATWTIRDWILAFIIGEC